MRPEQSNPGSRRPLRGLAAPDVGDAELALGGLHRTEAAGGGRRRCRRWWMWGRCLPPAPGAAAIRACAACAGSAWACCCCCCCDQGRDLDRSPGRGRSSGPASPARSGCTAFCSVVTACVAWPCCACSWACWAVSVFSAVCRLSMARLMSPSAIWLYSVAAPIVFSFPLKIGLSLVGRAVGDVVRYGGLREPVAVVGHLLLIGRRWSALVAGDAGVDLTAAGRRPRRTADSARTSRSGRPPAWPRWRRPAPGRWRSSRPRRGAWPGPQCPTTLRRGS